MNRLPVIVASLALAAFVAAGAVVALLWAPVNPDAGLFVPLARQIARGQVLYRDLPCDYPPLGPYALSLAGPRLLARPAFVTAAILAVQALGAALVAALVGRLGHASAVRWLVALVYLAWIWACEGTAVVLEPMVNLALLAAALALTWPGWLAALVGGLFFGAALATKQFAVLAAPGMLVWLVATRPPAPDQKDAPPRPRRMWLRLLAWIVAAAVPTVLFSLLAGVRIDRLVTDLASFGGRDYGAAGPKQFFHALTSGGPATPLAAIALAAVWLLLTQLRGRELALAILFFGTSAGLVIRDFPHYVQLPAPWGVLILVETSAMLSRRFAGHQRGTSQLLLLGSLIFVPVWLAAGGAMFDPGLVRARGRQLEVSESLGPIRTSWGNRRPVVLIAGAPWLHALADLNAPLGDYRFVPRLIDEATMRPANERIDALVSKADVVVLVDQAATPAAGRWLGDNGFDLAPAPPAAENVTIHERPHSPLEPR